MHASKRHSLALLAGVAVAAFALPAHAACEFKMGAMGPLAGPASAWGNAVRLGAEFVAAEANKAGGLEVNGEKCHVTVLPYDSKYTAEGAAAGSNYFASENIHFIMGPIGSPEATGGKPVAERNEQITFNSAYAKNAIGPQWPLAFHQTSGPGTWASAMVKVAKTTFKIASVALVAPNDQGGTDIASVDAEAYRAQGITAKEEYYQRGTTNFAPIIARILSYSPDAVDTASSPPGDGATIAKELREAGFNGPIGRLGGPGTPEILRAVGGVEKLKNFYWLEAVPVDEPEVKGLWAQYKQVMGQDAPDNTLFATSTAATRLLFKAITKAGTVTDAKKVAEALRTLPVEDPNLGKGTWTGEKLFGINQEIAYPVGAGLIVDGKWLGVHRIDVTATN